MQWQGANEILITFYIDVTFPASQRTETVNQKRPNLGFFPGSKKIARIYFPPHQVFTSGRRVNFFSFSLKYFPQSASKTYTRCWKFPGLQACEKKFSASNFRRDIQEFRTPHQLPQKFFRTTELGRINDSWVRLELLSDKIPMIYFLENQICADRRIDMVSCITDLPSL